MQQDKTPRRSILKSINPMTPPQMRPLSTEKAADMPSSRSEFWSPGNIPGLETGLSPTEELNAFGDLLRGGLAVLQTSNCDKRFEIYACFHLLLKNLTEKKILILVQVLPELLKKLKADLEQIEGAIIGKEAQDPFLARTDVQIVKIFVILFSNTKLYNSFWKKSAKIANLYARWCISQASAAIIRPTISKSLLSANLQLLKEQRMYPSLSQSVKEYILYALMNMKYFTSSSIFLEKINTLKSLITNCAPIMEKNVKSWIEFLFNCLCDFSSTISQKTVSTASILLLECAKTFISSKSVNFEIKRMMTSPIYQTLNVTPASLVSISSTPVDLQQPTMFYMTDRLLELIKCNNAKTALDIWLGITLLVYNDTTYLDEHPLIKSRWYQVLETCLLGNSVETQTLALKTWRGVIYVNANNIDHCSQESFELRLKMMFKVFDYGDEILVRHHQQIICSILSQISYALFNNPRIQNLLTPLMIEQHFFALFNRLLKERHVLISTFTVKLLNQLQATQSMSEQSFFLIKVMSTEKFDFSEVKPLSSDLVFQLHSSLFGMFREQVWKDSDISSNLRLGLLSSLMARVKTVPQSQLIGKRAEKLCRIVNGFKDFFGDYMSSLGEDATSKEILEHVNRLLILVKTNFGVVAFSELGESGELIYSHDNIYLSIVEYFLNKTLKITELLKCILTYVKTFKFKFFETLAIRVEDKNIHNYISNNLQSVIVDQTTTSSNIHALARTIKMIPKSFSLLKTFFSILHQTESPVSYFKSLDVSSWSSDDVILMYNYIIRKSPDLKPTLVQAIISKLQARDPEFAFKIFHHLIFVSDNDTLFQLREHFFFFVIDPYSSFSNDQNSNLLSLLKNFMDLIVMLSSSQIDAVFYHGYNLCSTLDSDEKYKGSRGRVANVRDTVYDYISKLTSGRDDDMPLLSKLLSSFCGHPENAHDPFPNTQMASEPGESELSHSNWDFNRRVIEHPVIVSSDERPSKESSVACDEGLLTVHECSGLDETQVIQENHDLLVDDVNLSPRDLILVRHLTSVKSSIIKDSNSASTQIINNAILAEDVTQPISGSLEIGSKAIILSSSTLSTPSIAPSVQQSGSVELAEPSHESSVVSVGGEHTVDDIVQMRAVALAGDPSETLGSFENPICPADDSSDELEKDNNPHLSPKSNEVIPDSHLSPVDEFSVTAQAVVETTASTDIESSPFKNIEDSIRQSPKRMLDMTSPINKRPRFEEQESEIPDSSPTKSLIRIRSQGHSSIGTVIPVLMSSELIRNTSNAVVESICGVLEGFSDEQLSSLTSEELYQIENQLLGFMTRMRSRR
jgi:hypothetical protein